MLCHQVDVGSTGDLEAQWERQAILTLSDFLLTGPPHLLNHEVPSQ